MRNEDHEDKQLRFKQEAAEKALFEALERQELRRLIIKYGVPK